MYFSTRDYSRLVWFPNDLGKLLVTADEGFLQARCHSVTQLTVQSTEGVKNSDIECLNVNYPRRARSALGVDTVLTLDVCLYVCMLVL